MADETASLQHCSAGNWANISARHMILNKGVQLYLHNTLVENNIKNEIQKISTGTSADKYIGAKLGLDHTELQTIDWRSLEKSQHLISADQQATRSKFAYRWAAAATKNCVLYRQADKCSQCRLPEDYSHVLTC